MAESQAPSGPVVVPRVGSDAAVEINRWWTIARIVTNVAHELNNTLQVISGNVEMLQARGPLDEATERRTKSIAAQAARAATAVDQLLGYARDAPSGIHAVDVHEVCSLALAFRSMSLGRARIAATLAREDQEPFSARADRRLVLQLVLDLLLAAERHLAGRAGASIAVRVGREDRDTVVTVDATAGGPATDRPSFADDSGAVAAAIATEAIAALAARQRIDVSEVASTQGVRYSLRIPAS
jgi:signal transduction histidine kinase